MVPVPDSAPELASWAPPAVAAPHLRVVKAIRLPDRAVGANLQRERSITSSLEALATLVSAAALGAGVPGLALLSPRRRLRIPG